MVFDWVLAVGMALSAVLAALGGVFILAALQAARPRQAESIFGTASNEVVFLFDHDTLIDATPSARAILSLGPDVGQGLSRLAAQLSVRFPGLQDRLKDLPAEGRFHLTAAGHPDEVLAVELIGGLTRLSLQQPNVTGSAADGVHLRALDTELASLRTTVNRAPYLIWREDAAGNVTWANTAYLREAADRLLPDQDLSWPLPRLFGNAVSVESASGLRLYLDSPKTPNAEAGRRWYDVRCIPEDGGRLTYAVPADAIVQAEGTLRDFMQTLTKTFAHLPTGLAIFDRQRQLQLFNPALIDLTSLQPDFLTMRPTLFAVLDAMRDRNMIPEPKNYRDWRRQMVDLEKAATSGIYEETWNLPSGLTYRVIGRPYPNGALALMFEDISTEMTRTRRYRADLELGQSVIDAMDDAMAVFSQSGLLVMTNTAYANLWGHDPAATISETSLADVMAHWRGRSAVSTQWTVAEEFLTASGAKAPWEGEVRLLDGRLVGCRFRGLQGGARLASFRVMHHPIGEQALPPPDPRKLA